MPTPGPEHLSSHHRTTRRQIFQDPVSHNIEWHAVVSLLEAVGSVEQRGAKVAVTIGRRPSTSILPRTRTSTPRPSSTCAGC